MIRSIIITALVLTSLLALPVWGNPLERNFAFEVDYGAANSTPLPLTDTGKKIYGSSIVTFPSGVHFLWASPLGIDVGISYQTSTWISSSSYAGSGGIYSDPKIKFDSISPFIAFPVFPTGEKGIIKGLFIQAGPSLNALTETLNFNSHPEDFTSSAISLDLALGFRTVNKEVLSFTARANVSIPLVSDLKRSLTGLGTNGMATLSVHAGACLSF